MKKKFPIILAAMSLIGCEKNAANKPLTSSSSLLSPKNAQQQSSLAPDDSATRSVSIHDLSIKVSALTRKFSTDVRKFIMVDILGVSVVQKKNSYDALSNLLKFGDLITDPDTRDIGSRRDIFTKDFKLLGKFFAQYKSILEQFDEYLVAHTPDNNTLDRIIRFLGYVELLMISQYREMDTGEEFLIEMERQLTGDPEPWVRPVVVHKIEYVGMGVEEFKKMHALCRSYHTELMGTKSMGSPIVDYSNCFSFLLYGSILFEAGQICLHHSYLTETDVELDRVKHCEAIIGYQVPFTIAREFAAATTITQSSPSAKVKHAYLQSLAESSGLVDDLVSRNYQETTRETYTHIQETIRDYFKSIHHHVLPVSQRSHN